MARQNFSTEQPKPQNFGPVHRITNYSTNLSDQEWLTVRPVLPRVMLNSKNRKVDLRSVLDAISYWAVNGVPLQKIPEDLPRPGTVHYFCYRFAHDGTFDKMFEVLGNKNPMMIGIHKKMKSLKWVNTAEDDAKEHNQYVVK